MKSFFIHLGRIRNMTNFQFQLIIFFALKQTLTDKAVTIYSGKMSIQQFTAIKFQLIKCENGQFDRTGSVVKEPSKRHQ